MCFMRVYTTMKKAPFLWLTPEARVVAWNQVEQINAALQQHSNITSMRSQEIATAFQQVLPADLEDVGPIVKTTSNPQGISINTVWSYRWYPLDNNNYSLTQKSLQDVQERLTEIRALLSKKAA